MAISGEYIKARREALNWTQQTLATKMNVTVRTIINWEQGGKIPSTTEPELKRILDNRPEMDSPQGYVIYVSKSELLKHGKLIIELI